MVQIVPTLVKEPRVSVQCPHCSVQLEYAKSQTPSTSTDFELSCAKCQHTFGPPSSSTGSSGKAQQRRRIGTQAAPLDTTYYDLLEVPIDADLEAIKKSYRRKALRHHPDKLPQGIPEAKRLEAEEHFKNLSAAYAVLSNPEERKKYNEFGPKGAQSAEGAMMDPEAVFSSLFGGDKFQDLIGKISIGAELKSSLQKEQEAQDSGDGDKLEDTKAAATKSRKDMTPEERAKARAEAEAKREKERKEAAERAKVREERVLELKDKLLKKMSIFTEQATSPTDAPVCRSVRAIWSIEAEELKMESYGVELLHSIGTTYCQRAQQYSASHNTVLGLGGWWSGMKQTANTFSETVSTLRSAYELTDIVQSSSVVLANQND